MADRDSKLRTIINERMSESGEKERLKELLRAKLIECGWRDELKKHAKEVVQQKGIENVTLNDIVTEITPKGRAMVPDPVKKELLQQIRDFLSKQENLL